MWTLDLIKDNNLRIANKYFTHELLNGLATVQVFLMILWFNNNSLGTGHYLWPGGGSGVKRFFFTENIFAAYSMRREKNLRPTRPCVKKFRCLLL